MPVMDAWTRREQTDEQRIEQVIQDVPTEPEQIDQIADIRGSFDAHGIGNSIINAYMNGDITVDEAVTKLAEPIEHCFTTANHGRAFYEEEMVARNQRQCHEPAKAAELWGVEQDFPEPTEEVRQKDTVEGLLWGLWFAVCHVSRKTPWDDEENQSKLVHLVRTIKARPDPPMPENATIALKRNWIWSSGKLWSDLSMLGPAARETWNDSPGVGWGMTTPEIHGWTNTNAFFARIIRAGLVHYWNLGIWALRDVLEQEPRGDAKGSQARHIDAGLPAAMVWIRILGEEAYRYASQNQRDQDVRYDVNEPGPKLGWEGMEVWTMARWVFWKEKFRVMAAREKLSDESREMAKGAAEYMEEIESRANE
ncbi:hypothetical protein M409DRAFT_59648 [Zasmidium cellare ATCC 36951]|uniref:Uncharacterized protein n=1 Tax=Zasmidium cellare ATCC 36951 TaxID=1080233 RepID=A0A6A6C4R9_ZASCE|nr:uncharacterized protein M409DRAFT_59648 [Zasmidium cellare ATCC 36951]KAF2160862.1 hypothetical protein M409DRAFT_59648 [Zasmidium cellare ATCC 36951]